MELLLNLIWVAISVAALLTWIFLRKSSCSRDNPEMLRGLTVVVCILALLFPVISMSDDLSQAVSLAEGARLQDMLKAPDLRGIYHSPAVVPEIIVPLRSESPSVASDPLAETSIIFYETFQITSVEKRPPPQFA